MAAAAAAAGVGVAASIAFMAGVTAVAGTAAGTAAGVVVMVGAMAGTGVMALALAATVAVAGFVAVAWAETWTWIVVFAGAANLGVLDVASAVLVMTSVALFVVLLPLLNAVFDWLSWLVGRWLGRDLAARLDPDAAGGWRRLGAFAVHVGADVALAVVSLIGLAWGIPRAIGLFNAGLRWLGLPTPLALGDYICRSALDPMGEGLWATLTLLSTFVPTAVHLGFLLAAPFAWLLSRGEIWQARVRHLRGQGPPPAVDLEPDAGVPAPPAGAPAPGLSEAGARYDLTLHPETIRQVALHLALVRWVLWVLAFLVACMLLWVGLELATLDWGSLSRFLLYVATGDPAAVATCFGDGTKTIVRASAGPP